MAVLPLIPFFLGYVMEIVHDPQPSYYFLVRIDTLFINKSGTDINKKSNAGLELNLKCQSYRLENLRCHILQTISYAATTDPVHLADSYVFTAAFVPFSGVRYRMEFDYKGVTNYHLLTENVKNKKALLKVYRFIGDQLSVGADLRTKCFEFDTMESTVIGKCPTHYKISRDKAAIRDRSAFELVSFLMRPDYSLTKSEAFLIDKQRNVDECHPENSYILGRILWTDLIPSNVTAKPTDSRTLMSFAQDDFYTKTRAEEHGRSIKYHLLNQTLRDTLSDLNLATNKITRRTYF